MSEGPAPPQSAGAELGAAKLVLGRYRLGGRLAAGSTGSVFAAEDVRGGRDVVLKLFDAEVDSNQPWTDEMRLALRLSHRHIVPCLDAGYDEGQGLEVLVFQRCRGGSLRRRLLTGPAPQPRRLLQEIADALAFAHSAGVVHRDVKPENILAEHEGPEPPWLLTDFGAGLFLSPGTEATTICGSLDYMAPEVLQRKTTALSDQYALGVLGLELLSGVLPNHRARSRFVLAQRGAGTLEGIVARLLEPLPERRFPSMALAARSLRAGRQGALGVGRRRDGAAFLLDGDELVEEPAGSRAGRAPRVQRAPRAKGLHCEDGEVVVALERRLLLLCDPPQTLYAAEAPFQVLSAGRCGAWLLQGEELAHVDAVGRRASGPAPAALRGPLLAGAQALGRQLGDEEAVLGVQGEAVILRCQRRQGEVVAEVQAAPGPLRELHHLGGIGVALCGDEDQAFVVLLTPRSTVVKWWLDAPADTVRLSHDGQGLRAQELTLPGAAALGEAIA